MECRNRCGFYGNEELKGYCSKCASSVCIEKIETATSLPQPNKMRKEESRLYCKVCSRRVKISDIPCRCGEPLCRAHNTPETHACTFDYKKNGKLLLNQQNPRISCNKVEQL